MIGTKAGEARSINVTFPSNYGSPALAGKPAVFDVTVKGIKAGAEVSIDDQLANNLGVGSLADLRGAVKRQLEGDFSRASRVHLKRRILDALDASHSFELPPGMVEAEFGAIWKQVEAEIAREGKTADEESKSDDELKSEYRGIAERRVRLGLILARIGEQNGLQVSEDELNRAVMAQARRYPGQETKIFDFIANNAQALAEIRVPVFEDKVVDFVAELITVDDREVDKDILFLDPDSAAERLEAASKAPAKAKASGSAGGTEKSGSDSEGEKKAKAKKKKKE